MQTQVIFNFHEAANINNWGIVDDVVMGGKSSGNFKLDSSGNGMFYGAISLENNGGFSSLRYRAEPISTKGFQNIVLRVKGDGKRYQFRVKANLNQSYSYVNYFTTSGQWETITIPLKELFPRFRGRNLNIPNFSADSISELGFLFGNKKAEDFKLIIDKIELQ